MSDLGDGTSRLFARGPFGWLARDQQARALSVLIVLTLALSMWLTVLGAPLLTEAAPGGIVSFELAGDAATTSTIFESWDATAREAAMLVQGVDFLYLVAYPASFSLAALLLARRLGGRWQRVGVAVAWAIWLAAPLDAFENLAMIHQLQTQPSDFAAGVARGFAVMKFALVAAAAIDLVVGLTALGLRTVAGARREAH